MQRPNLHVRFGGSRIAAIHALVMGGSVPLALLDGLAELRLCKVRFLRKAAEGRTQIRFKARDGSLCFRSDTSFRPHSLPEGCLSGMRLA